MSKQIPLFITLEGIEGVGKSTATQFIQSYLEEHSLPYLVTREPGGTAVAESIRKIFLQKQGEDLLSETELLLLFAARAQHLHHQILPALAAGKIVICDRFTEASYAYQGGGRGIDKTRIYYLEEWIQGNLRPDYVLLLDAPVDLCLTRTRARGHLDRLEQETTQFFERARAVYLDRARADPGRYAVIDASQPLGKVKAQLSECLRKRILSQQSIVEK